MVIGREDCRNVEAIAASSWGLGIKEVCAFDWVFLFCCLFFSFVYFVYLRSQCIVRSLLLCGIETNAWMPLQFLCSQYSLIDFFSLYVLFSHFRRCDSTPGNSFFQMSYARANVCITNDKNERKIPMRASRGLKWENKMYKLKRFILRWISPTHQSLSQKVYLQPKSNFSTLSFPWHHQKLFNILHQLFMKTVEAYFHCSAKKTILIYFAISMWKKCVFLLEC